MEIVYQHKPFSKNYNKPVDHFLFLLAVLSYRYNLARLTLKNFFVFNAKLYFQYNKHKTMLT